MTVPIPIVADAPLHITLHPRPGRLLPPAALAKAVAAWGELLDALTEDAGGGIVWGISDITVADDGAVLLTAHPQREAAP